MHLLMRKDFGKRKISNFFFFYSKRQQKREFMIVIKIFGFEIDKVIAFLTMFVYLRLLIFIPNGAMMLKLSLSWAYLRVSPMYTSSQFSKLS